VTKGVPGPYLLARSAAPSWPAAIFATPHDMCMLARLTTSNSAEREKREINIQSRDVGFVLSLSQATQTAYIYTLGMNNIRSELCARILFYFIAHRTI